MANEPSALAVETGIEAASNAVSALPMGQRAWSSKEHMIAETAASAALAAMPDRYAEGFEAAKAKASDAAHDAIHDAIESMNERDRVQSAVDDAIAALKPEDPTDAG